MEIALRLRCEPALRIGRERDARGDTIYVRHGPVGAPVLYTCMKGRRNPQAPFWEKKVT